MSKKLFNILAVDDQSVNIDLIVDLVDKEFEWGECVVYGALNAKDALAIILNEKIDLVLLDITMPRVDGFTFAKRLKDSPKTKDIPIIFLTSHYDDEHIRTAYEVGGVDYVNKPFNAVELLSRIKTHLFLKLYLEEIKEKQNRLAQLSTIDPLTKLSNLLYFESQLKNRLEQNEKFWIIFAKINNFEKLNNLYGFIKANRLIKEFAKLFKDVNISSSVIARLYGVQFASLTKAYSSKSIEDVTRRLRIEFTKNEFLSKSLTFSHSTIYIKEKKSIETIFLELRNSLLQGDF